MNRQDSPVRILSYYRACKSRSILVNRRNAIKLGDSPGASRRGRSRRVSRTGPAVVEGLEQRLLLSVSILNYRDDNESTGVNPNETILTPANVKTGSFGKLFATPVDGQVYAEPLVDEGVTIAAGVNTVAGAAGLHNVVYVAT